MIASITSRSSHSSRAAADKSCQLLPKMHGSFDFVTTADVPIPSVATATASSCINFTEFYVFREFTAPENSDRNSATPASAATFATKSSSSAPSAGIASSEKQNEISKTTSSYR